MTNMPSNCSALVKLSGELIDKICRDLFNKLSRLDRGELDLLIDDLRELTSRITLKLCSDHPDRISSIESLLIDLDNVYENLARDHRYICEFVRTVRRACRKKLVEYFELFRKLVDTITRFSPSIIVF